MRKWAEPAFGFPVLKAIHPLKTSKNNSGRIGAVIYKATTTDRVHLGYMQDNRRCSSSLHTVLRRAVAVSATPRLVVLNQYQMLPPFYARNIHCREPELAGNEAKNETVICSAALASQVRIFVCFLIRSDCTNCLREQVAVTHTLDLQKTEHA